MARYNRLPPAKSSTNKKEECKSDNSGRSSILPFIIMLRCLTYQILDRSAEARIILLPSWQPKAL